MKMMMYRMYIITGMNNVWGYIIEGKEI